MPSRSRWSSAARRRIYSSGSAAPWRALPASPAFGLPFRSTAAGRIGAAASRRRRVIRRGRCSRARPARTGGRAAARLRARAGLSRALGPRARSGAGLATLPLRRLLAARPVPRNCDHRQAARLMAMALELAADRCALLVVELQNDMVHESNIGKRGLGGRLAPEVARRAVLDKTARVLEAVPAVGVPALYVNACVKAGF